MKKGIVSILTGCIGVVIGAIAVGKVSHKNLCDEKKIAEKNWALYMLMNRWVRVRQEGKNVSDYLEKCGYHRIAIYGMSAVGETLLRELQGTSTEVAYGVDQNAGGICAEIDIYTLQDDLKEVDAIIVTPIGVFESIKQSLVSKVDWPILSIEDILYDM